MGIPGDDPGIDAIDIDDIMDVIHWYHMQISVKLIRATEGQMFEQDNRDLKDYPLDSDGSAKVALIGIDRSVEAWAAARFHFPDQEDAILRMLVLLSRLRSCVELKFPNAKAFRRPGFDDVSVA
jgi:hypothetical protein